MWCVDLEWDVVEVWWERGRFAGGCVELVWLVGDWEVWRLCDLDEEECFELGVCLWADCVVGVEGELVGWDGVVDVHCGSGVWERGVDGDWESCMSELRTRL